MEWDKALSDANKAAAKGDIEGVKEAFKDFMEIPLKHPAMASVFAYAYRTQIEKALKSKEEAHVLERAFKNYVALFGKDEQIENLYKIFKHYYKTSKLNIDLLPEGSTQKWHPAMIVESILD